MPTLPLSAFAGSATRIVDGHREADLRRLEMEPLAHLLIYANT